MNLFMHGTLGYGNHRSGPRCRVMQPRGRSFLGRSDLQIVTLYRSPHNLVSSQVDHNLSTIPQTTYPRTASLRRLTCGVLCRCPSLGGGSEKKKAKREKHIIEKKKFFYLRRDFSPKRTRRGKRKKKKRLPLPEEPLSIKRRKKKTRTGNHTDRRNRSCNRSIISHRSKISLLVPPPSCSTA